MGKGVGYPRACGKNICSNIRIFGFTTHHQGSNNDRCFPICDYHYHQQHQQGPLIEKIFVFQLGSLLLTSPASSSTSSDMSTTSSLAPGGQRHPPPPFYRFPQQQQQQQQQHLLSSIYARASSGLRSVPGSEAERALVEAFCGVVAWRGKEGEEREAQV